MKLPVTFPYQSFVEININNIMCYNIDTQKENTIRVTQLQTIPNTIGQDWELPVIPPPVTLFYLSYETKQEMELMYRFLEANVDNG
jgi:hypothetical protein